MNTTNKNESIGILKENNVLNIPENSKSFFLISSLSCALIHLVSIYNIFYNNSNDFKYFTQLDLALAAIFLLSTFSAWRKSINLIHKINDIYEYKNTSDEVRNYLEKSNSIYILVFCNLLLIGYLISVYLFYNLKAYSSFSLLSVSLVVILLELIIFYKTLTLIIGFKR